MYLPLDFVCSEVFNAFYEMLSLYSSYYYCILISENLVSKKLLHDSRHLLSIGVTLLMQVGVHSL